MTADNSLRVEVGHKIRSIRMSKGITGQRLAQMAKISAPYLSEIERGLSEASGEKLLRIANSLGVSVQTLLEGSPPEVRAANGVTIPITLAQAAEQLKLSYRDTVRLLGGRQSLVARRGSGGEVAWQVEDWLKFYRKVKDYLED